MTRAEGKPSGSREVTVAKEAFLISLVIFSCILWLYFSMACGEREIFATMFCCGISGEPIYHCLAHDN